MHNADNWQQLKYHYEQISSIHLDDLFEQDTNRFFNFSLQTDNIFLDYSKNNITEETLTLLLQLADASHLTQKIKALFAGDIVNTTENRPALHTALRDKSNHAIFINGVNVASQINASLAKMRQFTQAIQTGQWRGYTNEAITDIVNIGIGGSDLGPRMVCRALTPYANNKLRCHFVANLDATDIAEVLRPLNPKKTLFIVASKSFTTLETLCNAQTAREWLLNAMNDPAVLSKHMIAVTAQPERAIEFGISLTNIFETWDWVGGRFSLWSAFGLSIALATSMAQYEALLAGAQAMDQHFRHAQLRQNMPVLLGLLSVWYTNFFNTRSHAILPYDEYLNLFPAYLQQTEMESNGKQIQINGKLVEHTTAPVIWGATGTNSQHAVQQHLLQATQITPVDFILPVHSHNAINQHHQYLFANCLAQSRALMRGKTLAEVEQELTAAGLSDEAVQQLAPHKVIPGNRPSNSLIVEKITPHSLGMLLALYEHKTYVESVIWNINCFDQWGVQLGKQLAPQIHESMTTMDNNEIYDASTRGLIDIYRKVYHC